MTAISIFDYKSILSPHFSIIIKRFHKGEITILVSTVYIFNVIHGGSIFRLNLPVRQRITL